MTTASEMGKLSWKKRAKKYKSRAYMQKLAKLRHAKLDTPAA